MQTRALLCEAGLRLHAGRNDCVVVLLAILVVVVVEVVVDSAGSAGYIYGWHLASHNPTVARSVRDAWPCLCRGGWLLISFDSTKYFTEMPLISTGREQRGLHLGPPGRRGADDHHGPQAC